MQTFQHLFLNIPFNVMLALFKIGDGKASKRCRQSIALPAAQKNLPNLLNHPQGGLVEKLVRKRPMREVGRLRECGLPERWATLSRRFVFELSESPLQRQGGVDECVSIVVGVEDEVVADLHLSTNAEFCVF